MISGGVTPGVGEVETTATIWLRTGPAPWMPAGQLLEPRAFHTQQISADGTAVLIASGANVDGSNRSVQGTLTSEAWSTTSGQSTLGQPGKRIVVNGEEVCIPLPRLPKFPTGELAYILEFEEDPTLGPPIVYWMGGGFSAVPFAGEGAQPNTQDQATLYFSKAWELIGPVLGVGAGLRVTSIDQGLRRLAVGPNGAVLVTAE